MILCVVGMYWLSVIGLVHACAVSVSVLLKLLLIYIFLWIVL